MAKESTTCESKDNNIVAESIERIRKKKHQPLMHLPLYKRQFLMMYMSDKEYHSTLDELMTIEINAAIKDIKQKYSSRRRGK